MPVIAHIHTYARMNSGKNKGKWRCEDPLCTHYTERELIMNKATKCNEPGCDQVFLLDYDAMRRAKPKCPQHRNTKESKQLKEAQSKLADILKETEIQEEPEEIEEDIFKDLI